MLICKINWIERKGLKMPTVSEFRAQESIPIIANTLSSIDKNLERIANALEAIASIKDGEEERKEE